MEKNNECSEIERCRDRRATDAAYKSEVLTKLSNIESNLSALWEEMRDNRKDVKSIYFKMGIISGGTALVISAAVSLITKSL